MEHPVINLLRIGSDRNVNQKTERLEIEIAGSKFTLTATVDQKLHIHSHDDELVIHPGSRNEIQVTGITKD